MGIMREETMDGDDCSQGRVADMGLSSNGDLSGAYFEEGEGILGRRYHVLGCLWS